MSSTSTRRTTALATVAVAALLASSCANTTRDATAAGTTATPTTEATAPPTLDPVPDTERSDLGRLSDEMIKGTRLPAVGATAFAADRIIESDVAGVRRVGDSTPVQLSDKFLDPGAAVTDQRRHALSTIATTALVRPPGQ